VFGYVYHQKKGLKIYVRANEEEESDWRTLASIHGLTLEKRVTIKRSWEKSTPFFVFVDSLTVQSSSALLFKAAGIDVPPRASAIEYPSEIDAREFVEGGNRAVMVNRYERDFGARQECIRVFGCRCTVCGFDFKATYKATSERDSSTFTTLSRSPRSGKRTWLFPAATCALFAPTATKCFMRRRLRSRLKKCEPSSAEKAGVLEIVQHNLLMSGGPGAAPPLAELRRSAMLPITTRNEQYRIPIPYFGGYPDSSFWGVEGFDRFSGIEICRGGYAAVGSSKTYRQTFQRFIRRGFQCRAGAKDFSL